MTQQALLKQFHIDVAEKNCTGCKFAGSDPDGGYCGHEKSLAVSAGFGRSWAAARRDESICGPEGKLFEPMEESRAKALGTL